jgi:hypothetical protein
VSKLFRLDYFEVLEFFRQLMAFMLEDLFFFGVSLLKFLFSLGLNTFNVGVEDFVILLVL